MAIRLLPDGTFEVSTVQEAVALKRALGAENAQASAPTAAKGRQTTAQRGKKPKPAKPTGAPSAPRPLAVPGHLVLSPRSLELLEAVDALGANEDGTALSDLLNVTPKELPPRLMLLRRELLSAGIAIDDVVVRTKTYEKGRPKSSYKAGKDLPSVLARRGGLFAGGLAK